MVVVVVVVAGGGGHRGGYTLRGSNEQAAVRPVRLCHCLPRAALAAVLAGVCFGVYLAI